MNYSNTFVKTKNRFLFKVEQMFKQKAQFHEKNFIPVGSEQKMTIFNEDYTFNGPLIKAQAEKGQMNLFESSLQDKVVFKPKRSLMHCLIVSLYKDVEVQFGYKTHPLSAFAVLKDAYFVIRRSDKYQDAERYLTERYLHLSKEGDKGRSEYIQIQEETLDGLVDEYVSQSIESGKLTPKKKFAKEDPIAESYQVLGGYGSGKSTLIDSLILAPHASVNFSFLNPDVIKQFLGIEDAFSNRIDSATLQLQSEIIAVDQSRRHVESTIVADLVAGKLLAMRDRVPVIVDRGTISAQFMCRDCNGNVQPIPLALRSYIVSGNLVRTPSLETSAVECITLRGQETNRYIPTEYVLSSYKSLSEDLPSKMDLFIRLGQKSIDVVYNLFNGIPIPKITAWVDIPDRAVVVNKPVRFFSLVRHQTLNVEAQSGDELFPPISARMFNGLLAEYPANNLQLVLADKKHRPYGEFDPRINTFKITDEALFKRTPAVVQDRVNGLIKNAVDPLPFNMFLY